jgi:hypothetical protein
MARLSMTSTLAVPIAVFAAFLGPAYTGLHDRPAGEPFAYAMPEGFQRLHVEGPPRRTDANVWAHASLGNGGLVPNVSISHVNDMAAFDDPKLAHISEGMPELFEGTSITWHEVRHAQIKRRDGALVGLIEGENELGTERYRSLQVSFPDDRGASLVTASFPSLEASHWEPIFEAAIETTRGVATRGTRKPLWVFFLWGGGAGLASFGILALVGSRERRAAVPA